MWSLSTVAATAPTPCPPTPHAPAWCNSHRWGLRRDRDRRGTPAVHRPRSSTPTKQSPCPSSPPTASTPSTHPRRTVLDPILVDAATGAGRNRALWHNRERCHPGCCAVGSTASSAVTPLASHRWLEGPLGHWCRRHPLDRRRRRRCPDRVAGTGATASVYGYWSVSMSTATNGSSVERVAPESSPPTTTSLRVRRRQSVAHRTRRQRRVQRRGSRPHRRNWPADSPGRLRQPACAPSAGLPGHLRQPLRSRMGPVGDAGYWKDPVSPLMG